jgi:histidine triad (HIT) family protein
MTYDQNNIFAKIIRGEIPALKVHEDSHGIAFMDIMPWSDGHTLVIPKAAATGLFDVSPDVLAALIRQTQLVARAVNQAFKPDGLRLVQNNSAGAGQTVFHLHFHIVPCYDGVPLRLGEAVKADPVVLQEQAQRIRSALA